MTLPTFRSGDCGPLEAIVPQPLMVIGHDENVADVLGGRQAMPTELRAH
jgi:hypothetical protein